MDKKCHLEKLYKNSSLTTNTDKLLLVCYYKRLHQDSESFLFRKTCQFDAFEQRDYFLLLGQESTRRILRLRKQIAPPNPPIQGRRTQKTNAGAMLLLKYLLQNPDDTPKEFGNFCMQVVSSFRGPLLFSYSFKECYSPILTTCLDTPHLTFQGKPLICKKKTMIIRTPKDSQKSTQILNEIEIGICVEERHFKVNLMGLERKSRFLVNSWSSDSFSVEWLF